MCGETKNSGKWLKIFRGNLTSVTLGKNSKTSFGNIGSIDDEHRTAQDEILDFITARKRSFWEGNVFIGVCSQWFFFPINGMGQTQSPPRKKADPLSPNADPPDMVNRWS